MSACASAHVRRIWGDLDGGQRLPAYAPAHTSSRTGGGAAAVTRASSQPPAVLLDVLGRRVRIEAGGHPSAAQVDALWSRCRATDPGSAPGDETVITLPRSDRPLAPEAGLRLADQLRELALAAAADRLLVLRAAAVATPDGAVLALVSTDADTRDRRGGRAEPSRLRLRHRRAAGHRRVLRRGGVPRAAALRAGRADGPSPRPWPVPTPSGMRPCPDGPLHLAAVVLLEHDPAHRGTPELTRVRRPDDVRRLEGALVLRPGRLVGHRAARPDRRGRRAVGAEVRRDPRRRAGPGRAAWSGAPGSPPGPDQLYVAVGIGDSDDRPTAVSGHHLALDGLRRVVWMAAAGGASIEDLHAAANRELAGKTPISVQLVAAAVRDLMALRLLVPEEGLARGWRRARSRRRAARRPALTAARPWRCRSRPVGRSHDLLLHPPVPPRADRPFRRRPAPPLGRPRR